MKLTRLNDLLQKPPGSKIEPVESLEHLDKPEEVLKFEAEEEVEVTSLAPATKVTKEHIEKFMQLIQQGVEPEEATRTTGLNRLNIPPRELVKVFTESTLGNYYMNDAVRRQLVKASANKILIDSMMKGDSDTALKAIKQISSDPDVGLTAAPQPVVNININEAKEALDAVKDIEFDFAEE